MSEKIAGPKSNAIALNQGPLKERGRGVSEEKLREVASMYEKLFLREMVKQMRSTVQEGGFVKTNQAEKIFREQLDDQYVDKWSASGGVGFADVIYDQLMEKFGTQLGLKSLPQRPVGPIKLDEKSQISTKAAQTTDQSMTWILEGDGREVQAPWAGTLLKQVQVGAEENFLEIEHDNGLKSQIHFKGLAPSLGLPAKVLDGQRIGLISPDERQLIWTVQQNVSE